MSKEEMAAMLAAAPARVIVPGKTEVLTKNYVQAFAMTLRDMNMSRQRTANWLMGTLNTFSEFGGRIYDVEDKIYLPVTADLEDELADDSWAFATNVKRFAANPPRRVPQTRGLRRYQYFHGALALSGRLVTPFGGR